MTAKFTRYGGDDWASFVEVPGLQIWGVSEWLLEERLVYRSAFWPKPIVVPEGTITDLASIPRIFQPIIPQNGRHRLAAIVHDYLVHAPEFDRPLADRIFLEAMEVIGEKRWRRYVMYAGVRLFTFWLQVSRQKQEHRNG